MSVLEVFAESRAKIAKFLTLSGLFVPIWKTVAFLPESNEVLGFHSGSTVLVLENVTHRRISKLALQFIMDVERSEIHK